MSSTEVRKTPAPYGQSCANCVRAKCRCILREGGTCERCHRLLKECTPSTSVRQRGAKRSTTAKRSQLESKLDDLVSLLRTQNVTQSIASIPPNNSASTSSSIDCTTSDAPLDKPSSSSQSSRPSVQNPITGPPFLNISSSTVLTGTYTTLTDQDLHEFRADHLRCLPFIQLTEATAAAQLRLAKPITCLAIQTICCKSHLRQNELSRLTRKTLAERILVEGERSLDLLLGVLVLIAWSVYSTHGKAYLVSMSSLARSLISDLRLDNPPHSAGCPSIGPIVEEKPPRTNEERRALLACFALSASVCLTIKHDPMRWSAQVEEACHRLIIDAETEGDKVLAYAARIARLCVNAAGISRRAAEDPVFGRHAILQVGSLKSALEQLQSELPSDVSEHSAIVAYLYSAEVGIYELALYHHSAPLPICTHSPSSSNPELESRRIAYLTTLLLVCQSCIEFFLASDVTHSTAPSMLAFSYCIKIAYKLQTLRIPGWDAAIVRTVVDPVRCLERAAQVADAGNEMLKARTGEDSVFKNAAEHLWKSAPLWRVNFDAAQAAGMEGNVGMHSGAVEPVSFGGGGGELNGSWMDTEFASDFWLSGTLNFY